MNPAPAIKNREDRALFRRSPPGSSFVLSLLLSAFLQHNLQPPFLPLLFLPFALLHLPLPVGKILILAGTPALFLALPPLDLGLIKRLVGWIKLHQPVQIFLSPVPLGRSEERRVGKGGRTRGRARST